jgi:hypothetical protein
VNRSQTKFAASLSAGLGAIALVLAGAFWPTTALAQTTFLPVDEAVRQPDFFSFRSRLLVAIARRDTVALYAAIDPRIKTGFGGDDGIAAFKRQWRPGERASRIWPELAAILSLGGQFRGVDQFVAPYVYSAWPEKLDAFTHVAVISSRVNVRSAPRASAPLMGMLTFSIVALDPKTDTPGGPWRAVRMPNGRTGYVSAEFVRSPVGYRAFFQRSGRGWRMALLVSGD